MTDAATLEWLLEEDPANPGVRFFALQRLLGRSRDDPEVIEAQALVMRTGPVPRILAAQHPEGWWEKPGHGYSPKYRSTVWQVIALARLGADPLDDRVRAACEYVITHTQTAGGAFGCSSAVSDLPPAPSTPIHCLNGNLLASLIQLGRIEDERIHDAIRWQALAITGDPGVQYFASRTSGPGFRCGVNAGQPCAWGANKALLGLLAVPEGQRDAAVQRALEAGAEFLLSRDPAVADYPYSNRISDHWFRFGLPLGYWSDVMETLEVLTGLGYGADARLDAAFEFVLSKRDGAGRWLLEDTLNSRTWAGIERKGKPSKWVTLRAMAVLKAAGRA